jgi:RND family efflux transporter MFP subunit
VTDNDAAVKFAEAESNYKLSKADYERKKNLFSEKVVSEREYQAAEAQYKQAKARYESMQRNFGAGKVTLKSSFAGYIASMLVSNGDYVQPGTPLATVQRDGGMNIVAELPVRYSSMLQRIDKINVELPSGEVYDINALGGSLQAVGSAVNSCNMLPVTVSSASIPGVVPGCIVTLYLSATSGVEKSVAVPRTSLVEEMGNLFVFVQNSPVSFEKRSVKVGETDGYLVQLLDGVKAGERVVSKGGVILKLSQGAAALDPHAGHVH